MDVERVLKLVAALNNHIDSGVLSNNNYISLVKKYSKKSSNVDNLLKIAEYIQKSADGNIATKIRLARLIDSHIGHIIGLIQRGNPDKAKEYIEVIRPQGWEMNNERNVDKLYEQVIKGLAEKLPPEEFQALGL